MSFLVVDYTSRLTEIECDQGKKLRFKFSTWSEEKGKENFCRKVSFFDAESGYPDKGWAANVD